LGRYKIPVPQNQEALRHAVRTSLELTRLGSAAISFPLRAATCRSVLGGADFSVHLAGETGAFKSERAALEQQFFGAGMNRMNLPASWSSTGNALEITAFHGKDALLVIDDFAPHGSASDVNRYHATAERVFRAAGNHAGRGRLDSSARIREPRPPRGLILSTGEEIPRGHSIRARLLILEMAKGDIGSDALTKFQGYAREGVFAEAMGAFLTWIAKSYDSVQNRLAVRTSEFRIRFVTGIAHARTPDIVASLQAGFEAYLDFAETVGAIDRAGAEVLRRRDYPLGEVLGRDGAACSFRPVLRRDDLSSRPGDIAQERNRLMNSNLLNGVAIGFLYGMALVGFFSAIGFIAGVFQDWIGAKRKINTDVPELKDSVRELKLKVSFLESDIKRLERSRRYDPVIGKALLDEPPTDTGGS
jgi:hypothetical protein